MLRIIKYIMYDILRTRFMFIYFLFLLLSTIALFQLDSEASKVVMSLMNVVLMVVPLISVVFTTIHFYNSYEFIELMLIQPVNRKVVFWSEYLAVTISLSLAFLLGVGIPILLYGANASALMLLYSGLMLTLVFVSMAFLAAVLTRDKAKAIGVGLLFWFYFVLIYDAFVLWVIYTFSDYPLEKVSLALIAFNPVDLARILMLLQLDISALMGYTGAFFKNFFEGYAGFIFSTALLLVWMVLPVGFATRIFSKKDL
ncbi:ABC transporter permease subunit [Cytophagales bacterium LB-30]|uniref:ABC transporter permease subunit n=1 Tax=Shiella aurantiaca TaxID=3058365 RepID=A0ABT8F4W1_9BACT|nr:ABC transporter permease subunit [Shiella aurantiaca]MDN4165021.1 ABC transporter permease subunit [Shiella aurantiaca]